MNNSNRQMTFTCEQINKGSIDKVFALLCPVREKDWIDGWEYKMIHSVSGLIEENCVFSTPHHGNMTTVWQVTQFDPDNHQIEFVRLTPNENIVRINIELKPVGTNETKASISYKYTMLSNSDIDYQLFQMKKYFEESMKDWETSINHYLQTGKKWVKK